jgi:glutamate-ammonia-ligase adenylyltransferase
MALVCDRSNYGVELLCAHPEILEEVLRPEMLRRRKEPEDLAVELAKGPGPFPSWLWLYVRAEQLRYSIGELLGFLDLEGVENSLTRLAESVLLRLAGQAGMLVVALGKFGGGELTPGSDLDLLFVAEEGQESRAAAAVEQVRGTLNSGNPLGPTFALDLRLRPYGEAGTLVTTVDGLRAYYRPSAATGRPAAQTWEKQALVRARVVAGPPELAGRFQAWREQLLFAAPFSAAEEAEVWAMRRRIEQERDVVAPPERAFKTGSGGMIEIEFLIQTLQLRHGYAHPEARATGTRAAMGALALAGVLPHGAAGKLRSNYEFLRRIEFSLRRDTNRGVTILPDNPAGREILARWLGFSGEQAFWREHVGRLAETRKMVEALRR